MLEGLYADRYTLYDNFLSDLRTTIPPQYGRYVFLQGTVKSYIGKFFDSPIAGFPIDEIIPDLINSFGDFHPYRYSFERPWPHAALFFYGESS